MLLMNLLPIEVDVSCKTKYNDIWNNFDYLNAARAVKEGGNYGKSRNCHGK